MKKENAIRKLLGINQHDLALLLQVSRSQVAMYESGKRRLPLKAMEKLSKLLLFSQKEVLKNEKQNCVSEENQKMLQQLTGENLYQQHIVEKKIKAFEKKQKALTNAEKTLSLLLNEREIMNKEEILFVESLATTNKNKMALHNSNYLLQLQLKLEVLKFEERLLQEKLEIK